MNPNENPPRANKRSQTSVKSTSGPTPSLPREPAAMLQRLLEKREALEIDAANLPSTSGLSSVEPGIYHSTSDSEPTPSLPSERAARLQRYAEKIEARYAVNLASMSELSSAEPGIHRSTSGSQVSTACNYIRLKAEGDRGVFEYHVEFLPPVDARSEREIIISTCLLFSKIYDGGSCLYLPVKLQDAKSIYHYLNPYDKSKYVIIVKFIKQKRLNECLYIFNELFKKIMTILLKSQIGSNYNNPYTLVMPRHRLKVLPGIAVVADDYEDGVMICLDTQHRDIRMQTVHGFLGDLQCIYKRRMKERAIEALSGTIVSTSYNNISYRIDGVLWDKSPKSTFRTHDNKQVFYLQYYKAQYGIDIIDAKQPLLLSRQTKRVDTSENTVDYMILLIPELCYLTGLKDEMRADQTVTKEVDTYASVTTNQRMNALRKYVQNFQMTPLPKAFLSLWGLKLDGANVDILTQINDSKVILFGNGIEMDKADWNNTITKKQNVCLVDLRKWHVFYSSRDCIIARDFANAIVCLGEPMGIEIDMPHMHELQNDQTETYIATLRKLSLQEAQILVFICLTSHNDFYSAIKKFTCTEVAIPSEVIDRKALMDQQKVSSIARKLALQIYYKIGGVLWSVPIPIPKLMICSIDVYHGLENERSVCAFVCSLNNNMTHWYSTVILKDQELGDQFKVVFAKTLRKYKEINRVYPETIIIFRGGVVGDAGLKHCQTHEVTQFEACLEEYHLRQSKIVMVVVQNDINASDLDTIKRYSWYNFSLVHEPTTIPSCYIVIYDQVKIKSDHLQKLTLRLCHLYYDYKDSTIRIPVPCQYAHKLAYLVGQHVLQVPIEKLNDSLYYL